MTDTFFKIKKGAKLVPETGSVVSQKGDLATNDTTSKLEFHNGTITDPVVTEATAATLTNKSIDADTNTITNIENADIKAGAAIARNKLASGTADHVIINDGAGVLSSEAALNETRGGTGVQNPAGSTLSMPGADALVLNTTAASNLTLPTTGTLATLAGTETLTNKTLTTPVIDQIITSTNTDLNLNPNGTGKVTTDNLAFSGNKIESTNSNGDINLDPNGTGAVQLESRLNLPEQASPATPPSGYSSLYPKTDNKLYYKNDSGTEFELATTATDSGNVPSRLSNYSIDNSNNGTDLLVELKGKDGSDPSPSNIVSAAFRNSTEAAGSYDIVDTTSALNITLLQGANIGESLYLYLVNDTGTTDLMIRGTPWDTRYLVTTVAIDNTASDPEVSYSNAVYTSVPARFLGVLKTNLTTPGTYDSDAVLVALDNKDFRKRAYVRTSLTAGSSQSPATGNTDYITDVNLNVVIPRSGYYKLGVKGFFYVTDSQVVTSWTALRGRFGKSSTPGSALVGDPFNMRNQVSPSTASNIFQNNYGSPVFYESEPIYCKAGDVIYLNQRWSQQSGSAGTVSIASDGSANYPVTIFATAMDD